MTSAIFTVRGHVQGVGFRYWAQARADELGLAGYARNLANGRVEILAEGADAALDRLAELLEPGPGTTSRPGSVVDTLRIDTYARGSQGFGIA